MTVELELRQSNIESIFPDEDIRVQVGFTTRYAAAVNYGSDPHWPPMTPMVKWTNRLGWENYGLEASQPEDDLWAEVDRRRNEAEPLPGAYHLAAHIAAHGTKPMMYASDAFVQAQQEGEAWVEGRGYDAETPIEKIATDFGNWTLELANDNLVERVSAASFGNLQQSAFPAKVVSK